MGTRSGRRELEGVAPNGICSTLSANVTLLTFTVGAAEEGSVNSVLCEFCSWKLFEVEVDLLPE
jgi:hypothetical protein